jgi:hypothetical protein
MKTILFFIALIIPNVAMPYETVNYEVTKNISNKIEIREYRSMLLATISTNAESQNTHFRALLKFISGDNEQNKKINMTAPVFQQNINNQQSMSFVMPNNLTLENFPKPNNKNIKIELLENTKFIAIRFSGRAVNKNFNKHQIILEGEIKKHGLKIDLTNPVHAYYNPPWTLPFFKRNEVLFRLN